MRCLSLFSGCGGLDAGLRSAGFDLALASDLDPLCAKSHRANFPDSAFYEGTVTDLVGRRIFELIENADDIDLLVGGPPCQPFSKSRFYRKDKPRALADPMGNETINGYIGVMRHLKPRAFLFENVHGFAYRVHKLAFETLLASAREMGYKMSFGVLNAADYGVPQIRKRFFMIGARNQSIELPEPTHSATESEQSEDGKLPWVTAGDVLKDLPTAHDTNIPGHFAGGKHHELLKQVPPGDNYLYFTEKRGHPNPEFEWRSRYWSFLLKLSPTLPSWTIQARRSNNMGPFHWNNRILTIDEIKRLQTFPDDWKLSGTIEQQWRQLGNAVPPLLAFALGSHIRHSLTDSAAA
jgi:DNA (cytosine-5)-methyltransferase 1